MTMRRTPKLLAAVGILAVVAIGGADPAAAGNNPGCGNCAPASVARAGGHPSDDHTMPGSDPCTGCVPARQAS